MRRTREGLVWLVLGAVGLAVALTFYDEAFPIAGVELTVTRDEALRKAQEVLGERGFALEGYDWAATFTADELALVYLQRTVGLTRMSELARGEVPVYFWRVRAFRPLQKEEYVVRIAPDGRLLGFSRELPEDAPGADLPQDEARALAEAFLAERGVDLQRYEPVEASSERRKARTDHHFAWRLKGFEAGEAELRLWVRVQGDTIGGFGRFLKVSEAFERAYTRERSQGTLIALAVGLLLTLALAVGALVVFLRAYRAGELRWRFALGIALVILILQLLSIANGWPLLKAQYPTELDYATFLGITLIVSVIVVFIYAVWLLLNGGAGEHLARRLFPHSVRTLDDLLSRRFTRELALSSLRGYALAFATLGYFTLFYLVGRRAFGVWMPAEGPYTDILNTVAPFLYPLLIGFVAATTEEFAYRFFAIPFLKPRLGLFGALLFPTIVWGFAHTTYPVFPVWVRGIEVSLVGLAFGYCFVRYDLWTVLVAHYAINAILGGLPLLTSGSAYFQLSGVAVMALGLLPALLALPGLLRRPQGQGQPPAGESGPGA